MRAVRAAIEPPIALYAMSDNPARTMRARRSELLNSALKAVE
jgi:hypothetical protein